MELSRNKFKKIDKNKLKRYFDFIEKLPNMSNKQVLDFYKKTDAQTIDKMFLDEFSNYELGMNPEYGSASKTFNESITLIKNTEDKKAILDKKDFIIITSPDDAQNKINEKVNFIPFNKIFFQCGIRYINHKNQVSVIDSFIILKDNNNSSYNVFFTEKLPQEKLKKHFCHHQFKEIDMDSNNWISECYSDADDVNDIHNINDGEKRFTIILNIIRYVSYKISTKQYHKYYKFENNRLIQKELIYSSEVKSHKRHFWEDTGRFIIPNLPKEEILKRGYFIDELVFKNGELRRNVPYTIIENFEKNKDLERKNRIISLIKKRIWRCEEKIYGILREIFPNNIIRRHDRRTLKGIELDFNLPELRLGIEYDGEQHFDKELYEKLYGDGFDEQVRRDRKKDKLCIKKKITLIRIKYDEPLTKTYINKKLKL